jgi:putative iron-regulated protein
MKMKLKVMFNRLLGRAPFALVLGATAACSGDPGGAAPVPDGSEDAIKSARVTYADIVLASYEDSLAAATELDSRVGELVGDPSADAIDGARTAWVDAREPYLQTEVYRFYGGPIDNPDDGPEGLINAWPLDENYIDYVEDNPEAGIINDIEQEITEDSLSGLNEGGGEKNVSTGYHAIEFLLWGQDHSAEGPGDRPYTDYVTDGSGTAENQDRRGEYLGTVSALLVDDLDGLVTAWQVNEADNYRAEFLTVSPQETLRRMLTGMRILAGNETGGERLEAALRTGEQEDEHSCFSDNTHRDMIQDVQGIMNVWKGNYVRTDGTVVSGDGIETVIAAKNTGLAGDLDAKLAECLELANALQIPFDQEIKPENTEGRERVGALVHALQDFAGLVDDAFRLFELEVTVETP